MENFDKTEVIAKIQKLLSLANSPNEFEAKLAADKASELLTRYNLKISQIEGYQSEKAHKNFTKGKTRASWEHKFIRDIITRFFFVKVVETKPYMNGQYCQGWSILGDEHNVIVAAYVYDFLDCTFRRLFQEYKAKTNCQASARQSYYTGLRSGLSVQLQGTRNKVQTETSLMVVQDPKIDDYIKEVFGKTTSTSVSFNVNDRSALEQGSVDGKNIKIAKGLDGGPTQQSNLMIGQKGVGSAK